MIWDAGDVPSSECHSLGYRRTVMAGVPVTHSFSSRGRQVAPFLYLILLACAVSWVHVAKYTVLSPIDELRHFDYALQVSDLNLPRLGDSLGQEAMRIEACRGVDLAGWVDPPCRTRHFAPKDFRDNGYQTATPHPPGYYVAVGALGRFFDSVGLANDPLGPMRLAGGLLLAAGLCLAFVVGLRLGIGTSAMLAALTFVPLMAAVLHSSATVNPDSTAVFAGAVVLLASVAWEQRRLSTRWLAAATAFATFLKFTNFLGVLFVAGYLLVRARPLETVRAARRRRHGDHAESDVAVGSVKDITDGTVAVTDHKVETESRSARQYLRAAAIIVTVSIVVAMVWIVFDRARATISPYEVPQNRMFELDGLPRWREVFAPFNVLAWLPPRDSYLPFSTEYLTDVQTFMSLLFGGAVIIAALRFARTDRFSAYGGVALFLAIVGRGDVRHHDPCRGALRDEPLPRDGGGRGLVGAHARRPRAPVVNCRGVDDGLAGNDVDDTHPGLTHCGGRRGTRCRGRDRASPRGHRSSNSLYEERTEPRARGQLEPKPRTRLDGPRGAPPSRRRARARLHDARARW